MERGDVCHLYQEGKGSKVTVFSCPRDFVRVSVLSSPGIACLVTLPRLSSGIIELLVSIFGFPTD